MKNKLFWIILSLVVLSVATSYIHRYFIGNANLDYNFPVITDGVIPAIAPRS